MTALDIFTPSEVWVEGSRENSCLSMYGTSPTLVGGRWSVEGCMPTRTVRRLDVGTIKPQGVLLIKNDAGPMMKPVVDLIWRLK